MLSHEAYGGETFIFKHQINMHLGVGAPDIIYHNQIHRCFSLNLLMKVNKLQNVARDLVNFFGENPQTIDYKINDVYN